MSHVVCLLNVEADRIPQMEDVRRDLLDKALVLYRQLEGQRPAPGTISDPSPDDPRIGLRTELRMETAMAQRRLADIYRERGEAGDKQSAEQAYQRAIGEFQRLVDRFPGEPEFPCRLAETHNRRGELLRPYATDAMNPDPARRSPPNRATTNGHWRLTDSR